MTASQRIEQALKVFGVLVAAAGFLWGIYQYFDKRDREIENTRVEAARPFLERQLKLYRSQPGRGSAGDLRGQRPAQQGGETLL